MSGQNRKQNNSSSSAILSTIAAVGKFYIIRGYMDKNSFSEESN